MVVVESAFTILSPRKVHVVSPEMSL